MDLSRDAIFNTDFSVCFMVTAFSSVIGDFVLRVSCHISGGICGWIRILDLNYSFIFNFYKVTILSINSLQFSLNRNFIAETIRSIIKS